MADHDENEVFLAVGANLALEAVAAEVTEALRAAGLRSIFIKGPALTRWLYGSESARTSSDVDLLIDPATIVSAEAALRKLGYERAATGIGAAERPRHASTWVRLGAPDVDLHTNLVGIGAGPAEVWAVLGERTALELVGGARLEVPGPEVRFLLLALHAGQHGEREPQPLRDLARALEVGTKEDWINAAALAERLRAEAAFAAGLGLLGPGRALCGELQLSSAPTVESALRVKTAPALTLGLDWLVRLPGLEPRVSFAVRKVFPPAAFMRAWSPLARRGRLGLGCAYLWRVFWLIGHTAPAVRAWRRARKESQP